MTIDKAIEIGEKTLKANYKYLDPDFRKFIKLGIKALIRERNNRINPGAYRDIPLPGETEE